MRNPSPKVLIFACAWCGAVGASGAGRRRCDLPAGFRLIEVPCAGFVEPDAIIRAFSLGVDGVLVLGCHLGGCRQHTGNHAALKRLTLLKDLLETAGIGAGRLALGFGTAHEADPFAETVRGFFAALRDMPPLAVREMPASVTAAPAVSPGSGEHRCLGDG